MDLRVRVIGDISTGASRREAAKRYGSAPVWWCFGPSALSRPEALHEWRQHIAAEEHAGFLLGLITEQPDLTASHSGGPLDAAMRGLQTLPGVCLTSLPRMADFALWATACGTALWPAGTFARAYDANRKAAVEEIIEADPVAVCVRKLMAERSSWAGTAYPPNHDMLRARVRALWGLSGWRGNERIADSIKKGPPGARAGGGCCSGSDRG
jgi:hypothetical protein